MIEFVGDNVTEEVDNAHTVEMVIAVVGKRERILVGMGTALLMQLRWRQEWVTDVFNKL